MRAAWLAALMLAAAGSAGCQTAVGHYFAERARDLGDCFEARASLGLGIGVSARAFGVAEAGLLWSRSAVDCGWDFGRPVAHRSEIDEGNAFRVALPIGAMEFRYSDALSRGRPIWQLRPLLLPALTTIEPFASLQRDESEWLWGPPGENQSASSRQARRWSRVHAFDVGVEAWVGFGGLRLGFSPGEFLDFVLGWFGLDIAGDDRAFEPPR